MAKGQDQTRPQNDWQAMSQQYWNAWSDATRKAFGALPEAVDADKTPWHEGLEQWSRMFDAGKAQNAQSEMVERLLAGARSYFSLLQTLAEKGTHGDADPQAWTDAVRQSFNFPGADTALLDNPLARALRELAGHGAKGFEQMMEAVQPAMRETRVLLDLPAFGYAREHQEHYQRMGKAWLDYQRETNRYNALIARASRRAFEVFEDKLAERGEPGRQIDSARGLYDLWVDAAEDAYAEIALSDEFREVYGALVNAQMRVRQNVQKEVERVATDLGMPTRTEIDSMGKRLHALHRDAKNQAETLPDLVAEVVALRAEVERLKAGSAAKNGARKAPRKSGKTTARE
ncbi:MAG: class III poly(R)-hydroxyalkanoic acid synthase subunit PhaE [Xanthomonadaceae bacterium]|nr:class III poly(R)-hydroxyalkanoic acid synthase subunit PhaE [Xanthomonadaceae bacterium]MDE2055484.1 class III poly(R)-hydroxyalkanoic acid synthase subunit PhaE [Xanthomonadaceae bacterium]